MRSFFFTAATAIAFAVTTVSTSAQVVTVTIGADFKSWGDVKLVHPHDRNERWLRSVKDMVIAAGCKPDVVQVIVDEVRVMRTRPDNEFSRSVRELSAFMKKEGCPVKE